MLNNPVRPGLFFIKAVFCFSFLLAVSVSSFVYAATLNLQQSGQTLCYDINGSVISCTGTRQDGDIKAGVAWPSPRFSVSGDCVTDNLTGLMWAKDANRSGSMNWTSAISDINGLNASGLCDHADWRVPNINELLSLVHAGYREESCSGSDCSYLFSWLNSAGFQNVMAGYYWSSSYDVADKSGLLIVGMWDGETARGIRSTDDANYLWPVRGSSFGVWKTGQKECYDSSGVAADCAGSRLDGETQAGAEWPETRFVVSGDCVTDNLTGLIWAKDANLFPGKLWQEALNSVKGLSLCGHADWRLPNVTELESLVDRSRNNPPLPSGHPFINVQSGYWSSTTFARIPVRVWGVGIGNNGYSGQIDKQGLYADGSVWPVRGGICGNKPAMIGETVAEYDSIGAAYSAAVSPKTILARALPRIDEALLFAGNKIITLAGGFDCRFETKYSFTTISSLTIGGAGAVTVDRIKIK